MDQRPQFKSKMIKFLEENKDKSLWPWIWQWFLKYGTKKTLATKGKVDELEPH